MKKLILLGLICAITACSAPDKEKPNVLLIISDDLRSPLGDYDFPEVITPNIDELAAEGVQFNRAYCNVPVCGASRASFLTGLRPHWPDRMRNYLTRVDEECPNTTVLSQHFINNGYTAISNGKIFHHQDDKADAWSEYPYRPDVTTVIDFSDVDYHDSASIQYINPKSGAGPYFEAADAPDSVYNDAKVAQKSMNDLKRLASQNNPFFLAVGFQRPHLPFNVPKKYFDLYDSVEIADNRFTPENLPRQVRNSGEIFTYGRLDHYNSLEFHYEARKAYLASVSFVDHLTGQILQTLEELELDENTIVVFIGDHGWNLGEHNYWGKHNVFHHSLHSPMIIKAAGLKHKEINEIVEYLDLYPTLCDMAGLELPDHLQGASMLSLMEGKDDNWKNKAFCEWQGARTVLTQNYSYSYWFEDKHNGAELLFDHMKDPAENKNVVNEEEYETVVKEHRQLIDSLYSTFEP